MKIVSNREIMTRPAPEADKRLAYAEGASRFVDFRYPVGPSRGLAVMIHGGFWRNRFDLTYAGNLCAALTAEGYTTANLEYRRTGESGGGWPGTFDDIAAGYAFARAHTGLDRAVALGHSAGGHLALWLATQTNTLAGVVALGPVSCLQIAWDQRLSDCAVGELLGSLDEFPERYAAACPSRHATSVPRVLIHGADDDVAPPAMSHEFLRLRSHDAGAVTLISAPGVDHFHVVDPRSHAWPSVLGAVDDLMAGRPVQPR